MLFHNVFSCVLIRVYYGKNAGGRMCENIVSEGYPSWRAVVHSCSVAMGEGSGIRIAIGNYVREKFNSASGKKRQDEVLFSCYFLRQNRSHVYNSRVSPENQPITAARTGKFVVVVVRIHAYTNRCTQITWKTRQNPSWKTLPIELRETMRDVWNDN